MLKTIKTRTNDLFKMSIHKQFFCDTAIFTMAVVLFTFCGCVQNGRFTGRLANSGPTEETHLPQTGIEISVLPIDVHDLTTWLENSSSIKLEFHYNGLIVNMSGTEDGAIFKYSNIGKWEIYNHSIFGFVCYKREDDHEDIPIGIRYGVENWFEVNLDIEKWQEILKRLYNSGIRDWNIRKGVKVKGPPIIYMWIESCIIWTFYMHWGNGDIKDISISNGGCDKFPSNWSVFKNAMDDIIKDIIRIPLNTEYKKRFGMPISDFEHSIMLVRFEETTILKTISGTIKATNVSFFGDYSNDVIIILNKH